MKKFKKLYRLRSVAQEITHHNDVYSNVKICWIVRDRTRSVVPYKQGIKNYKSTSQDIKVYAKSALNELFLPDEAIAFAAYLLAQHNQATIFEPVILPIESNAVPVDILPAGGGVDYYQIFKEEKYSLPFNVWGQYDLRWPGETFEVFAPEIQQKAYGGVMTPF